MKLAQVSGIETPTRADLARIDRKRKKKGSNDDWTRPACGLPNASIASPR
jgi:transposase